MDYTDIYSNLNLNYRHCCLGCKPRKLKLSDLAQKVLNDSDFLVIEYDTRTQILTNWNISGKSGIRMTAIRGI